MTLLIGAQHLAIAATCEHLVERLMGQQSVVGYGIDGEIDAIVSRVCMATVDELADHRHHLADVLGRARGVIGAKHAHARLGVEPDALALLRDVLPRPVFGVRPIDDLVVDVGDVRDEPHLQTAPPQVADQYVVDDVLAAVPDVRR